MAGVNVPNEVYSTAPDIALCGYLLVLHRLTSATASERGCNRQCEGGQEEDLS